MSRSNSVLVAATLAGLLIGLGVAVTLGARADIPKADLPPDATAADLGDEAMDAAVGATDAARRTAVVEAVERAAPAVVSIATETPVHDPFVPIRSRTSSSEGSGVVIDADGVVLTNAHVVANATRITATLSDDHGQPAGSFEAAILGLDEDLDLAVLKLEGATGLVAVPVASSADLMLGEPVIAIGNPYGLGPTVTTGVVSSLSRSLQTSERVYQDFIQTDASINPGNSGGPLLDVHGRLVGINTAIYEAAQGIGFAIPSDRATKIARDLLAFGSVQAPWLGVDMVDVSLRPLQMDRSAVQITRVHAVGDGPATALRQGDVLLAVDGRAVQGRADLNAYLANYTPGRAVNVTVLRDSQETTLDVATQALPDAVVDLALSTGLGVEVATLTPEAAARAGLRNGGVIVNKATTDGGFARSGFRPGDLIVAVNGSPVRSADELRTALARAKSGHRPTALITVRRGSGVARATLPI